MKCGTFVLTGKLGLMLFLLQNLVVESAEIKIIGSTGVASVVTELVRQYEPKSGNKIQTDFAVIAVSKRKIDAGTPFDVAILGPSTIDELIQKGKIIGDTPVSFGRTGLGVMARKGGVRPDLGSADAFKRTMLAAKSVGHSKEGLSGVQFLAILERLGIAAEMKAKLKTYEGSGLPQAIAMGEVELGVTGLGTVISVPSVEFVSALPKEIQAYVVFTAGIGSSTKELAASKAMLQFMTGPDCAPVFKANGMERD